MAGKVGASSGYYVGFFLFFAPTAGFFHSAYAHRSCIAPKRHRYLLLYARTEDLAPDYTAVSDSSIRKILYTDCNRVIWRPGFTVFEIADICAPIPRSLRVGRIKLRCAQALSGSDALGLAALARPTTNDAPIRTCALYIPALFHRLTSTSLPSSLPKRIRSVPIWPVLLSGYYTFRLEA